MKVAVCYSGQIGGLSKAITNHRHAFLDANDCDIYCYTSDAVSQKDNTAVNLDPVTKPQPYLPAGMGWRKNYKTYGIIYKVTEDLIKDLFDQCFGEKLVSYVIEEEVVGDTTHDTNMTKWEWMRMRQLHKLKECNELRKKSGKDYDLVIRSRFDFVLGVQINLESVIAFVNGLENMENKIFVFGGFGCSPPMIFMDEYFCDGFVFGTPKVMDVFSSLVDHETPYNPHPKYVANWEKWGDSIEHQFRSHMLANDIEICYISTQRSTYAIAR
tara:strand:+ start:1197 stop:2006 length:810 start_codon:yes stop_codon:yes gene_type:complete